VKGFNLVFVKGSTASSQIVKRVHDTVRLGTHGSWVYVLLRQKSACRWREAERFWKATLRNSS